MTVANSSQKYLPSSVRQVRLGAALFVFYVAMLLMLIECRPLWLDEVIQLEGTSAGGWQGLVRHVLQNAGGAPLGYLGQQWLISIAGCSIWTASFCRWLRGRAAWLCSLLWVRNLDSIGPRRSWERHCGPFAP